MNRYYTFEGKLYRALLATEDGEWIIGSDGKHVPRLVGLSELTLADEPQRADTEEVSDKQKVEQNRRMKLIAPLVECEEAVYDRSIRRALLRNISADKGVREQLVLDYYCLYLWGGDDALIPAERNARRNGDAKIFREAIKKYKHSSRQMTLRKTYEMMLADSYTDSQGRLYENYPTFSVFRHFYYRNIHSERNEAISQKGLSYYQRNARPLYGKARVSTDPIGVFEMDATEMDVYITSRYDRSKTIGRPILYVAVDRATQLMTSI